MTTREMSMPDRLNERPIYLRAILLSMAVVQSLKHLYFDYSCLHLPISAPPLPSAKDQGTHFIEPISAKMQKACLRILWQSIIAVAPSPILGPFIYTLFLRQTFWWMHLQLAKPFFNISRADARPTGYPPCNPLLIGRTLVAEYLLVVTWETTTLLFSTYLVQEPLKKEQPLSAASKDPNGTIVTGLKAKREVVKTFAFWELAIIAQRFPERRKAIFADIERPDGARWPQMLHLALDVVQGIQRRIIPPALTAPVASAQNDSATEVVRLPRIVPDVDTEPILLNPPKPQTVGEQVEAVVGNSLKWVGQSKEPWSPPVQKVKGLLQYAKPPGGDVESDKGLVKPWWSFLQISPVRWLFSCTPERKVNALVLGSPYGNAALLTDAINGVTKMLVASLSEDVYGKAISGVPEAVRVFTGAINAIEGLLQQSDELHEAEIDEANAVLQYLKSGLTELLSAFQLYLSDVGLGISELNAAKKAAAKRTLDAEDRVDSCPEGSDVDGGEPIGGILFDQYRRRVPERGSSGDSRTRESRKKREEPLNASRHTTSGGDSKTRWNGMNGRPGRRREMEMYNKRD
jgi:nucleoporin NDC1